VVIDSRSTVGGFAQFGDEKVSFEIMGPAGIRMTQGEQCVSYHATSLQGRMARIEYAMRLASEELNASRSSPWVVTDGALGKGL